jgi:predicted  nucleic acid-binding Zn-ribbon protein
LNDQSSNAEISKSKEEKQCAKHEKAHNDATKELEKLANEAEKVEEDMAAQQSDVSGIRQQAEEAQDVRNYQHVSTINSNKELRHSRHAKRSFRSSRKNLMRRRPRLTSLALWRSKCEISSRKARRL